MKIESILLLFFLFAFFQNVNAQIDSDEMVRMKYRFYYQNKIYTKNEVGKILEKNEKAYDLYKVSQSIKKKANIAGFTSLGLIGVGILSIGIAENRCRFSGNCPWYGIAGISFITTCVAGSAGIAMKIDAKGKMKNSLEMFNEDNGIGELDLKIDIGKVGLVLTF